MRCDARTPQHNARTPQHNARTPQNSLHSLTHSLIHSLTFNCPTPSGPRRNVNDKEVHRRLGRPHHVLAGRNELHDPLRQLRSLIPVPPPPLLVQVAEVGGRNVVLLPAEVAYPPPPVLDPGDKGIHVGPAPLAPDDAAAPWVDDVDAVGCFALAGVDTPTTTTTTTTTATTSLGTQGGRRQGTDQGADWDLAAGGHGGGRGDLTDCRSEEPFGGCNGQINALHVVNWLLGLRGLLVLLVLLVILRAVVRVRGGLLGLGVLLLLELRLLLGGAVVAAGRRRHVRVRARLDLVELGGGGGLAVKLSLLGLLDNGRGLV